MTMQCCTVLLVQHLLFTLNTEGKKNTEDYAKVSGKGPPPPKKKEEKNIFISKYIIRNINVRKCHIWVLSNIHNIL